MANETILIVEDDASNLKLAKLCLVKHGYHVLEATSGEEALAVLNENRPHLILMDIQLPELDGLQLTQFLKSKRDTRNIIILAVTAFALKGDEEKALDAGCDGYITKPFDTSNLHNIVAEYIAKYK